MKIDLNNIKQFNSYVGKFNRPCDGCGVQINDIAGMIIQKQGRNLCVCPICCGSISDAGIEDLYLKHQSIEKQKTELVDFIKINRPYQKIFPNTIEELKKQVDIINDELQKQKMIDDDINQNFVETPMEQYLIDDYDVYETTNIKSHLQIEKYFKQNARDMFDCGQGYYEDQIYVVLKIGDKFYEVHIEAEVLNNRMDYGDDVYFVERIEKVEYREIEKPEPLGRVIYKCEMNLNMKQKDLFLEFIKTKNIDITFTSIKTIGKYA